MKFSKGPGGTWSLAVLGVVALCQARPALGYEWTEWPVSEGGNGHFYALTPRNTWWACRDEAVAAGGHLVTINDAAEDAWLYQQYGTPGIHENQRWIGFNDFAVEGHWEWVGGDGGWWEQDNAASTSYVNWYLLGDGEPDGGDYEDTAVINYGDQNPGWTDYPQEYATAYGIIEVPEPATFGLLAVGGLVMLRRRG